MTLFCSQTYIPSGRSVFLKEKRINKDKLNAAQHVYSRPLPQISQQLSSTLFWHVIVWGTAEAGLEVLEMCFRWNIGGFYSGVLLHVFHPSELWKTIVNSRAAELYPSQILAAGWKATLLDLKVFRIIAVSF